MNALLGALISKDSAAILAFADANMRLKPASEALGVHIETLSRRLDSVYKRTKLNPKNFRDLVELVKMVEGVSDV